MGVRALATVYVSRQIRSERNVTALLAHHRVGSRGLAASRYGQGFSLSFREILRFSADKRQ